MKRIFALLLALLLLAALTGCWPLEEQYTEKPVIYLYPEAETDVTVRLDYVGDLTCTYPAYDGTWHVTAAPDGMLTDERGQTYRYLYWEGTDNVQYDFSEGFCVPGSETAAFLEDALAQLGLTRAEAATIFYRLLLDTSLTKSVSFSDVKAGSWYENAVKVLASKGVIAGYPDGSFKPNQAVTRAEFFKMVAMLYSDTLNTPITGGIFKDINGHWAEKYINLLQKLGIVKGDNGSARPNDNLTRGETAAVMNRILGRVVNNSSFSDAKVAAAMKTWPDCTSSHWAYAEIQEATNSHDYTWDINILTYSDHNGIFKAFIENLKNPVTERWTYIKK